MLIVMGEIKAAAFQDTLGDKNCKLHESGINNSTLGGRNAKIQLAKKELEHV